MPEQLEFDFTEPLPEPSPEPDTPEVSAELPSVFVGKHPRGWSVQLANGNGEIFVFPHLGTALSEAKRILLGG